MLNLNDARMFVRAVDDGGFTAAARALGVPKSTVSKRIAELERELGTTLVHRSSRRFVLTPVGREFHRRAAAMVSLAEDAEAAVRGSLAEPSGLVRITSSLPTAQTWLAALLPKIAAAYPKMRIAHHATDRFVDVVREGFDMAVRAHFSPLPDSDLVQRRLGRDPFWLVASPRYLAKRGVPKVPEDLASHDALFATTSDTTFTLEPTRGPAITVSPHARFFADETEVLLGAARADLGIAALPSKLCASAITSRQLRRVLPTWTAGHVTTTILMPTRRADLPSVRALAAALAAHASSA